MLRRKPTRVELKPEDKEEVRVSCQPDSDCLPVVTVWLFLLMYFQHLPQTILLVPSSRPLGENRQLRQLRTLTLQKRSTASSL